MKIIGYHNISWTIIIILFLLSPIQYDGVSIDGVVGIVTYMLIANIFFFFGYYKKQKVRQFYLNEEKLYKIIIVLSILSFVMQVLDIIQLRNRFDFSINLSGFTSLRYDQARSGMARGANLSGVLATILSGFPIIGFILYMYVDSINPKRRKRLVYVCIIGFFLTFISGGRISALVYFFVLLFGYLIKSHKKSILYRKLENPFSYLQFNKKRKKIRRILILMPVILIAIFSTISLARAKYSSGDIDSYMSYIISNSKYPIKPYANTLLHSKFSAVYYNVFSFHIYLSHSIKEFDNTLHSSPSNFPYLGGYQFSSFTLFFNKFGFDLLPIDEILHEIVNPGLYFTLPGAFYLDFGPVFMYLMIGLFFFAAGRVNSKFVQAENFNLFILMLLFSIILAFSPLFSIIGMANFPPLIVATIIVFLLPLKRK